MKTPIRKKTTLDGMDRNILKNMYQTQRNLSGRQIAQRVNMSSSAIVSRLNNLRLKGIIRPMKVQQPRIFNRTFKIKGTNKTVTRNISAPRSVFWGIDFKDEKRKFFEED